PTEADRQEIFRYYLSPPRLKEFDRLDQIDLALLASKATLFTPADIRVVVQTAARRRVQSVASGPLMLTTEELLRVGQQHPRRIRREMASEWMGEVTEELGPHQPQLLWLGEEIARAFGTR